MQVMRWDVLLLIVQILEMVWLAFLGMMSLCSVRKQPTAFYLNGGVMVMMIAGITVMKLVIVFL